MIASALRRLELDQPAACRGLRGRFADRRAREHLAQAGEDDEHDRAGERRHADPEMERKADREIERHPRQIEQGRRAGARHERADRVEIAHRLLGVMSGFREPDGRVIDARTKLRIDLSADADEQASAHGVEQRLENEQNGRQHAQRDESWHAAARQHAVVDLQHEQRSGQHQDVDQPAEHADADEGRLGRPECSTQLGSFGRCYPLLHEALPGEKKMAMN